MRFKDFLLHEMAKRTTPEEFYKMAVKLFGAEKSQSLTMPEVVLLAKNNDAQIPNYVVKNKVGRGRFNLRPEGTKSEPTDAALKATVGRMINDLGAIKYAPKKEATKITEKDCIDIANDFIYMMKSTDRGIDVQHPEKHGNNISASVRHWGRWEISQSDRYDHDDGDLEDWDWEVLSDVSRKKLNDIEQQLKKKWLAKFSDVDIYITTDEKNWISITIQVPKTP